MQHEAVGEHYRLVVVTEGGNDTKGTRNEGANSFQLTMLFARQGYMPSDVKIVDKRDRGQFGLVSFPSLSP